MMIAIIILSVLLAISIYVIVNLLLKVEKLEDMATTSLEDYEKLSNDIIKICKSDITLKLIQPPGINFLSILREKLGWGFKP